MAGPNDFTGQNIQDTYQRVLQISSSGQITDGTGSLVPLLEVTASFAISASHEITFEVSSSHAETADFLTPGNDINVRHITASGNISSSGFGSFSGAVTAGQLRANGRIYPNYNLSTSHFIRNTSVTNPIVSAVGGFHTNGNITASGNISASGDINVGNTGSFAYIKSSGDISASGNGFFNDLTVADDTITKQLFVRNTAAGGIIYDNSNNTTQGSITFTGGGFLEEGNHGINLFAASSNPSSATHLFVTQSGGTGMGYGKVGINTLTPTKELQVSGDISASGDINVTNITASGDISASGQIYVENVYANDRLYLNNIPAVGISGTELQIGNANTWTSITYGRNVDDTHGFTGNVNIAGNIDVHSDISSSTGRFIGNGLSLNNESNVLYSVFNDPFIMSLGSDAVGGSSHVLRASDQRLIMNSQNVFTVEIEGNITASGNLEVEGNISSSGNLIGNIDGGSF